MLRDALLYKIYNSKSWSMRYLDQYWLSTDFYRFLQAFYWLSADFYWLSTGLPLTSAGFYWLSTGSTGSYWLKFETITDRATGVGSRDASASKNGVFFSRLMLMHNNAFCR